MQKLLLTLTLLLAVNLSTQAQGEIKWLTFEEAVEKNQETPKMVLVDIYTDWCGWCKKMDKGTFTDPEVIRYVNDNFYPVKMNAEDSKRKFNFRGHEYTEQSMSRAMRISSYPNFIIMDAAMENITQMPGYREAANFLETLQAVLKQFNP
nr:thioredoxin fold domain-containing protein [Litoribacter populi]